MSDKKKHRLWRSLMVVCVIVVLLFISVMTVFAIEYDLSVGSSNDFVEINDGIFQKFNPTDPTGTGTFQSFLRVQNNNIEKGYNTSYRPVQFDEKTDGNFTISIPLNQVPKFTIDGIIYREFVCDLNQTNGNPLISLDQFQVWITPKYMPGTTNWVNGYDLANMKFPDSIGAIKVYDINDFNLDGILEGTNWIKLDYNMNKGSGKRDYRALIPDSLFDHTEPADGWYVVIFTEFGRQIPANDGFEEWGVRVVNYASKTGVKFEDLNANGVKDAGEPGLEGWTIYVDINGNSSFDAGEPFGVTNEIGEYEITSIPAGTYRVREVMQSGWVQSYPAIGYHEETFVGGVLYPNNDFGNWYPATKSGMKFEDLDADGVKDALEPGLAGWRIFVDYDDDGVWDDGDEPSAVTAADGTYQITGIEPGTYKVREVAQTGWTNSFPALGYYEVTFTSRLADTGNDFGNWRYATKSGYKFRDDDGDGVFDAEEVGLEGWTIKLWTGSPGDLVLVDTAVTDINGYYCFDEIIPGITYYVSEVIPDPMWIQTFPTPTTTGAMYIEGLGSVWVINLISGQVHENNNFGNVYYHDETAWAYDPVTGFANPFSVASKKLTNWGWTNGPYTLDLVGTGRVLDLYAGAGLNDINKGTLVGHVTLIKVDNNLEVRYSMIGNNVLEEIHLWVGSEYLPKIKGKFTNAPGQFPYDMDDFTYDPVNKYYTITITNPPTNFYVAAHAVVRMYEIMD